VLDRLDIRIVQPIHHAKQCGQKLCRQCSGDDTPTLIVIFAGRYPEITNEVAEWL